MRTRSPPARQARAWTARGATGRGRLRQPRSRYNLCGYVIRPSPAALVESPVCSTTALPTHARRWVLVCRGRPRRTERALYHTDPPPEVPDLLKDQLENVVNLLSKEEKFSTDLDLPCEHIISVREYFIPDTAPEAGPMPIGFAYLLRKDVRKSSLTHRVYLAGMYMSRSPLEKYHHTWINTIHLFLFVYTNASRPRTRATSCWQCCFDNVEGYDSFDNEKDVKNPNHPDSDEEDESDENSYSDKNYQMDVQKCISTISNLFLESTRLSGEESETFNIQLKPIIGLMNALSIPTKHQPVVLFSLKTAVFKHLHRPYRGKACEAAWRIPV